jgi:hypothetical protein
MPGWARPCTSKRQKNRDATKAFLWPCGFRCRKALGRSLYFVENWLTRRCAGKRVLDYCCGAGDYALLIAEAGGKS